MAQKKLEVDKVYIISEFWGGKKQLARVVEEKGWFRKRYKAKVWGVLADGRHEWPNGGMGYYENWLKPDEVNRAKLYDAETEAKKQESLRRLTGR